MEFGTHHLRHHVPEVRLCNVRPGRATRSYSGQTEVIVALLSALALAFRSRVLVAGIHIE